jgi:hypothetical protein
MLGFQISTPKFDMLTGTAPSIPCGELGGGGVSGLEATVGDGEFAFAVSLAGERAGGLVLCELSFGFFM